MTLSARNKRLSLWVGGLFLAGLLLPFIFFRSVYPFYRFGMFAEPMVGKDRLVEMFYAEYESPNQAIRFLPKSIGMTNSQWEALSRNYFYRNEAGLLLTNLQEIVKGSRQWKLYRIVWNGEESDTLLVFSHNNLLK